MYEIKKYRSKIFLCSDAGTKEEFSSTEEIAKKYGRRFLSESVGASFRFCKYVILDEWGDAVAPLASRRRRFRRSTFVEKGSPVPGTGKSGNYGFFRSIRTYAEAKLNARVVNEEGEPSCRPSRRAEKLSGLMWDDNVRHVERSWKRHRDHQWKQK